MLRILPAEKPMPYKNNKSRRHKIEKSRYKMTNWHEYNNGLRRLGDITIWFVEAAIASSARFAANRRNILISPTNMDALPGNRRQGVCE